MGISCQLKYKRSPRSSWVVCITKAVRHTGSTSHRHTKPHVRTSQSSFDHKVALGGLRVSKKAKRYAVLGSLRSQLDSVFFVTRSRYPNISQNSTPYYDYAWEYIQSGINTLVNSSLDEILHCKPGPQKEKRHPSPASPTSHGNYGCHFGSEKQFLYENISNRKLISSLIQLLMNSGAREASRQQKRQHPPHIYPSPDVPWQLENSLSHDDTLIWH